MPGFLPAVTPSIGSYGQDVKDRRPVKDPTMESGADDYNNLRADLAYVAQTAPRSVVRVTGGATPAVAFFAPSFKASPSVAWVGVGTGHIVTFGALSTIRGAIATLETNAVCGCTISGNTVTVFNATAANFTLAVW